MNRWIHCRIIRNGVETYYFERNLSKGILFNLQFFEIRALITTIFSSASDIIVYIEDRA